MSLSDLLVFFLLLLNLDFASLASASLASASLVSAGSHIVPSSLVSAGAHIAPSSIVSALSTTSADYGSLSSLSAKKTVITEDAFTWDGRTYPAQTYTADDTPDPATVSESSPLAHHGLPTSTIVRLVTLPPTAAASVPVTFVTSYVRAESLPATAGAHVPPTSSVDSPAGADLYYTRPTASPLAASKSMGVPSSRSTYNGSEAHSSGSSTASAYFGSPTSGALYDQDGLTCTFDSANKVTIQGVVGEWGGIYLKDTLSACSHRINDYKDHFAKLANATQTIDFHIGDVEINQGCIERAIRVAGGTLGPQGCRWAHIDPKTTTQTSPTADDPASYPRPRVSVNWWPGMKDNDDYFPWGFWELYNISDWRTPNYASHDWPILSGADIARNLYTLLGKCDQSIYMNYEYWRQAYDTTNNPVLFFGLDIDKQLDCFTNAIRQSGGPNPYEYGITQQAHNNRWQTWHKGLAPFKFVEQLPKHDQFSGWPNLTLPAGGFGTEGKVCFPTQGEKPDCRSS